MALQVAGGALTIAAAYILASRGIVMPPFVAAFVTGAFAAGLTRLASLDPWWLWIQLLFAPGAVLVSSASLPRWIWIVLFGGLAAVYWSTFRTQVPLYLSSSKVREALVALLPPGPFKFMDVGSGVGGVLMDLASQRADGEYHGIETAPVPWLISWIRIRAGGYANCHAQWGSFWDCDLNHYDVVFAYLSPVPMAALWDKVQREMRPGSVFISNAFAVAGEGPDRVVVVDDLRGSKLHVWTHR